MKTKRNKKINRETASNKAYVLPNKQCCPRTRALLIQEALKDSDIGAYLPPYLPETSRYCPTDRNHSEANWSAKHGTFSIRYSIPRIGGKNKRTVVASVWVEPKKFSGHGVKGRLHIDVNKLVGPLIESILSKDFQKIGDPWGNVPSLSEAVALEKMKDDSLGNQ